jgi:hypothetical protein
MTDPRINMVMLVKEHITNPVIKNIAQWLVSDQANHFYEAPFSNFSGKYQPDRWSGKGGLVEATLAGYGPLRILLKTADTIYTTPSVDRVVAIYLLLMISRAIDVKRGLVTVDSSGSISTVAVANAIAFGMVDLDIGEIQALTKWWASRKEMTGAHESFHVSWWIINQTLDWVFTASRAK